jgi:hypothetical protein
VQVLLGLAAATHALAYTGLQANVATSATAALGLLAAPFAYNLVAFAFTNHTQPERIKPLKQLALRWHMAMTAALFLALFTSGISLHGPDSLA